MDSSVTGIFNPKKIRFRILEKLWWGFVFWKNYLRFLLFGSNVISVPTSIIWHHFHNNISNYLSTFAWKFPWKKDEFCVIFEGKPTFFCSNRLRYRSLRLTILLLRVSMDRRSTYKYINNHNKIYYEIQLWEFFEYLGHS